MQPVLIILSTTATNTRWAIKIGLCGAARPVGKPFRSDRRANTIGVAINAVPV